MLGQNRTKFNKNLVCYHILIGLTSLKGYVPYPFKYTLCYAIVLPGRKSTFRAGSPISGPEALMRNIEYPLRYT